MNAKENIKYFWNERAKSFDESFGHGIHSQREDKAWTKLFTDISNNKEATVLDMGCGTAEVSKILSKIYKKIYGLDFAPNMVKLAKEKVLLNSLKNVEIIEGDATNPSFTSEKFDIIFARHLLWTIPNPKETLNKWKTLLKKDGILIISDGNWQEKTIKKTLCSTLSNIIKKISQKKDPEDKFSDKFANYYEEIYKEFDFPSGLKEEKTREILKELGFNTINAYDTSEIIKAQKASAPLHFKVLDRKCGRYTIYASL